MGGGTLTGPVRFENAGVSEGSISISDFGELKIGDTHGLSGAIFQFKFSPSGFITRTSNTTPTSGVHMFYSNGVETHRITADGTGTFKGGIITDNFGYFDSGIRVGGRTSATAVVQLLDDGQVSMRKFLNVEKEGGGDNTLQYKAGDGLFLGSSKASGNIDLQQVHNASITDAGKAYFASTLEVGGFKGSNNTETGITVVNGHIKINRTGQTALTIKNTGIDTIKLKTNGDAMFSGTVTVNGDRPLILNEGTAGEVNVKERLDLAKETFQELRVAVAAATDFSDLKAAMLVALEDWA